VCSISKLFAVKKNELRLLFLPCFLSVASPRRIFSQSSGRGGCRTTRVAPLTFSSRVGAAPV
jgi:hypothetical protein